MAVADVVVQNATIHTMDDSFPRATALAIRGGRIVLVGNDRAALRLVGPHTEIVDCAGAAIVPGLIDAHNHHHLAGEEDLFNLQVPASASVDDICRDVEEWISDRALPPGEWVVGGNFGSGLLPELERAEALARLDRAAPNHPVMLNDDSHHNRWVNSRALAAAGLGRDSEDPPGGRLVRDAEGELTGLLYESAAGFVEQRLVQDTGVDVDRLAASSERAIELLHEHGVTSFQDASTGLGLLQALARLDQRGRLRARVVTSMLVNDTILGTPFVGRPLLEVAAAFRTPRHRPDFTKIYLDGVPPTRTAALLQPYPDDDPAAHPHFGRPTMSQDELTGWLREIHGLSLGVKVHCTGDASVRMVLDAVETVRAEHCTLPVQIAHAQLIHPDDVPRFAQLGVTAEISPYLWYPGEITASLCAVLPRDLSERIHPNRDLLDAGALLVVGSDWPVSESPNPWHAISGLVTRRDPTGRSAATQWPEQAISRREALRACTVSAASALGLGEVAGRLSAGFSADFVVLSEDPLTVPIERLADIVAVETWFEGSRVYRRHDHRAGPHTLHLASPTNTHQKED